MILSTEEIKDIFDHIVEKQGLSEKHIAKKLVHKRDAAQVVISDINQVDDSAIRRYCVDKPIHSIYYCQAYPNLECQLCFDHPLDHYPLMKQFELIRQFGIASCHTHFNVPVEGTVVIANKIHFDYLSFGELDVSLAIICVDLNVEMNRGVLKKRDSEFYYVQQGRLCAFANTTLTTMKGDLYQKLRKKSRSKVLSIPEPGRILTNIDILQLRAPVRAGINSWTFSF